MGRIFRITFLGAIVCFTCMSCRPSLNKSAASSGGAENSGEISLYKAGNRLASNFNDTYLDNI